MEFWTHFRLHTVCDRCVLRWELEPPEHEEGWSPFEMDVCVDLNRGWLPAGIASVEAPDDAPELCLEKQSSDGSEPRKVRYTAAMRVADAVAWQACIEGNHERLKVALAKGSNANFRRAGVRLRDAPSPRLVRTQAIPTTT